MTGWHERAVDLVARMTDAEVLGCLDGDAPFWAGLGFLGKGGYHQQPFGAARVERLGFDGIAFSDGPRGVVVGNATAFPVSMARGATWNPELEERVGDAIGRELRATGANLYGGVCINLLRHPAWGRAQETYGEDPFHVGEMGAALTRGIQRHAMATVKHLALNSMENARFRVDVAVDEVALHEVYLPQFKRIVDEGVACVMTAYNQVNGTYCGEHRELITGVLRDEWGFDGFTISDWIYGIRDAAASLNAGLDIEMPYRQVRADHLPAAIERGETTMATARDAVTRVVETVLGFDERVGDAPPDRSAIGADEHRRLAREVAAASVVVLRNEAVDGEPLLPLRPDRLTELAVVGRFAKRINLGDAGSSDVWDIAAEPIAAGIGKVLGEGPLTTVRWDDDDIGDSIQRSADAAADSDAAVVVVGYSEADEGEFIGDAGIDLRFLLPTPDDPDLAAAFEARVADLPATTTPPHRADSLRDTGTGFGIGGDRTSLRLRADDVELIRAVAAVNERTVVAIQAGSAVIVEEWIDEVPAVVQPFYGGAAAGLGLADVLFGAVNPSARLPFTVPTDESHLPAFDRDADRVTYDRWHGWWYAEHHGHEPRFPFGFGLSYTTFEITDVEIDGLRAKGRVANIGDRDGAEVVRVYARLPLDDRPRRLVGFARVEVAAGASEPFDITVDPDRVKIREQGAWRPVDGVELSLD